MKIFFIPVFCLLLLSISCSRAISSKDAKVISIASSSTLSDKQNRYITANLSDGADTSWCEGKEDDGIGEWIRITFDQNCRMDQIFAVNGYGESGFWQKNNRIKELKISTDREQVTLVTLPDTKEKQSVKLPAPVEGRIFTFTIISVYPGTKYKDTCMTELAFSDFTLKNLKRPVFCGRTFSSFNFNVVYLDLNLVADGKINGKGFGGWQCGQFSSGSWKSDNNGNIFEIHYYITGEGGDTCGPVNEHGSFALETCPVNDKVIFEDKAHNRKIKCDYVYDDGRIIIDKCDTLE